MVSILIVTYNSQEYIAQCITSFLRTSVVLEIIIVDNHSKDSTVGIISELATQHEKLEIQLIVNSQNEGFSKAMNQAYAVSTGKYVMTFNPDAEMLPGTLEEMVGFLEANENVGMIGVPLKDSSGELHLPGFLFPKFNELQILKTVKANRNSAHHTIDMSCPFEVNWLIGTGFLVNKKALNNDWMYEETSFLFWEEYYLAKNIRSAGYRIFIMPQLEILHHISSSFKFNKDKLQMARLLSFSHEYGIREKHYGKMNAFLNFLLYLLDFGILSFYLKTKKLFKPHDLSLHLVLEDYLIRCRSAFLILILSKKKRKEIDVQAKNYFNSF